MVKKKLKLPHAAAQAKDFGAKHIIFARSSNGPFSKPPREPFNDVKRHVQEQGHTHMGISFRDTVTSFNTRFWGSYWHQCLCCALVGTSVFGALYILATDRPRSASGGKNIPFAPREYGRIGYDTPVAQPTTFRVKSHHTDGVNTIADETNSIFAGDYASHSHTGAGALWILQVAMLTAWVTITP